MIYIIGIGEDGIDGLLPYARSKLQESDVIVGGKRHLELVREFIHLKDVITIGSDLEAVLKLVEEKFKMGKKVVVLNSGDPLFFGFAKRLIEHFGKDNCQVIPTLSSVQLAFSKIKESWDDAKIISIHTRAKIQDYIWDILENEKIAILTSGKEDPKIVAEFLANNNIVVKNFFVFENLGGKSERILNLKIDEVKNYDFSMLNIIVIIKDKISRKFNFGLPEESFKYHTVKRGIITKAELRAIAISKLSLKEDSVVWDIGSGSGSVAIECALLSRKGKVYAIEKNEDLVEIIRSNKLKFGAYNLEIVLGEAPEILRKLEDPDSIFIGGGGGNIEEILSECLSREKLKNIVATFIVPSHFVRCYEFLKSKGYSPNAFFFNFMKLKDIGGYEKFDSYAETFLIHLSL